MDRSKDEKIQFKQSKTEMESLIRYLLTDRNAISISFVAHLSTGYFLKEKRVAQ